MADAKTEKIEIKVQENDVKQQEMDKVAGGGLVVGTL
jgi:hypothetical protein